MPGLQRWHAPDRAATEWRTATLLRASASPAGPKAGAGREARAAEGMFNSRQANQGSANGRPSNQEASLTRPPSPPRPCPRPGDIDDVAARGGRIFSVPGNPQPDPEVDASDLIQLEGAVRKFTRPFRDKADAKPGRDERHQGPGVAPQECSLARTKQVDAFLRAPTLFSIRRYCGHLRRACFAHLFSCGPNQGFTSNSTPTLTRRLVSLLGSEINLF